MDSKRMLLKSRSRSAAVCCVLFLVISAVTRVQASKGGFRVFPADTKLFGGLAKLQKQWWDTMLNVPEGIPHPKVSESPACLPFNSNGVRMVTDTATEVTGPCNVTSSDYIFLPVFTSWIAFSCPGDCYTVNGWPADSSSADTYNRALLTPCADKLVLKIDGKEVNVKSYYRTSSPAFFYTTINEWSQLAFGYTDAAQSSAPSTIGGFFALLRLEKRSTPYVIKYGLKSKCSVNVKAKLKPFKWAQPQKCPADSASTPASCTDLKTFTYRSLSEVGYFPAETFDSFKSEKIVKFYVS